MDKQYDIVIIGAGIHGVGVAQAAAAQGYSVLVLEQSAIAAGTSSKSSKLIHGGLRYLETAQFSLVKECLRERALLLNLAPELVKLVPFYIPIYKHTRRGPWKIRAGLMLYQFLANNSPSSRFQVLDKSEWPALDGLQQKDLLSVFRYHDAQTDDVLLSKAVMSSAETLGAQLCVPARFTQGTIHKTHCDVHFEYENTSVQCVAKVIVNAAGPWVSEVQKKISPQRFNLNIELVQGTHVLIEGQLNQGIYYLEAPHDQRAVFVMPWHQKILIGTTENVYYGNPAEVKPLADEIEYLLQTYHRYFPQTQKPDAISAFAGLRVLPMSEGSPFKRKREVQLLLDNEDKPKLLSIVGGKLTAYRATAERVMHRLKPSLPPSLARGDTHLLPLNDPT
ncbi:MAG: glycerol-3-phosphate dehydrogenase/oxidase [Gammaproteobacteria bacterium]|nr:glycerol-3-phosphate dehydrogenase/oxidase [Gammaproteobacteria bacterium]